MSYSYIVFTFDFSLFCCLMLLYLLLPNEGYIFCCICVSLRSLNFVFNLFSEAKLRENLELR